MTRPLPAAFAGLLALFAATHVLAAATADRPEALDDGWTVAAPAEVGVDPARLAELSARVEDQTFKNITSILVAREGKLLYEAYFNDGKRERLNDVRSASKSVTSLLVGAAIDRGLISGVDAKVFEFFKDRRWAHPDPRKLAFTLEDLLTMSASWECNDDNPYSSGNEERMYVTEDWLQFALDLPMRGYAPWDTVPADAPYGRSFSYCTAGTLVLGAVIERAAGKSLSAFAREVLEAPLGITQARWNLASGGVTMGGGGTRYRSRDLLKLAELVRAGGRWQGEQVISARYIDAALTPRAVPREHMEYGYLFWRMGTTEGRPTEWVWAMTGNGGNYVIVAPEQDLVAVITSTAYNQSYAHPQSQKILREYLLKAVEASP
jgi:CubicO group peptidase (beta-lactamase class C family)